MLISTNRSPLDQVPAEALIVPTFEGDKEKRFGAADLAEAGEIAGKPLEITLLHHPAGLAARRVLLAGGGPAAKYDAAMARKLAGAAARFLKSKSLRNLAFALDPAHNNPDYARAVVEGAILADFDPARYQTGDTQKPLETFTVVPATPFAGFEEAVDRGRIVAEAQNFARQLVNEPANRLVPLGIADSARQMSREFG